MKCWLVCTQIVVEQVYVRLELLAASGNLLGCSDCMNVAAMFGELGLECTARHPKPSVVEGLYTIAGLVDHSLHGKLVVHFLEKVKQRKKKSQSWH